MNDYEVVLNLIDESLMNHIVRVSEAKDETGRKQALRLLLYSYLKEVFSSHDLINHLKKRRNILKKLGVEGLPEPEKIEKWKKDFDYEIQQILGIAFKRYVQLSETEWDIIDPVPHVEIVS